MKKHLLSAIPHVAAIVIFLIISCIYFAPIFSGLDLRQGDIRHHKAMSKEIKDYNAIHGERIYWSNNMFGGMPTYQTMTVRDGNWMGGLLSIYTLGLPRPIGVIFVAMLGFYILCLCMKIDPWLSIVGGIGFGLASIFMLYLGAGHTSKMMALALIPPVLGGVILAYRGKIIQGGVLTALFMALHLYANHFQVTYYLLYLLLFSAVPIGIGMIMKGKTKEFIKASLVLVAAGLIGLMPSASNLLSTKEYAESTIRGKSELTINPDGSEKDENLETSLDPDYILEYNLSPGELFSIAIPNVKGGRSGDFSRQKDVFGGIGTQNKNIIKQLPVSSYWGRQSFTGGAFYFGALMVALFIIGLVVVKNPIKWGILVLTLLTFGLALESGGIVHFFINKIPFFDKFRDSKMMLMIVQLMMPLIAVMGLDQLIKNREDLGKIKKPVMITSAVIALFAVLLLAAPKMFFDFHAENDEEVYQSVLAQINDEVTTQEIFQDVIKARVNIFRADALRSTGFILAGLGLLLLFVFRKVNHIVLISGLGLLTLIDLAGVDRRYLNNEKVGKNYQHYMDPFEKEFPYVASAADMEILNAEKNFAENYEETEKDLFNAYKPKLDGQKKKKEKEQLLRQVSQFGALNLSTDYRVLTLTSLTQDSETSFFHKSLGGYHGAKLMRYQEMIDHHINPEMQTWAGEANTIGPIEAFKKTSVINMLNTKYLIYNKEAPPIANPSALGNAWFVDEIEMVENSDEEIIKIGEIDINTTATVDERYAEIVSGITQIDSTANIELIEYDPQRLTYESNSDKKQMAVFSEIFYDKGWKAYVNDEPTDHFRANYFLRGMVLPAGQNTIEFVFEPSTVKTGRTISMIGSVLIILLLLMVVFVEIKGFKKSDPELAVDKGSTED